MASEVIKLNLIPKGEMPVFHASQFDTGRLITCELYRGEDAYSVPEGYTVELHCRKVDNNIVTMASTLINDNVVTFTSTEQLTACNGNNLCEVAILDEGYRIGTLNFILEVEIDPLKGGITSTSEIHNLETQVEEIATEIIGENYYNKTEVDDLLDAKADASSVYTKSETDTKLALKANAADVYTKLQTDTLLNAKADSSDVYTKGQVDSALALKANAADVYTKGQVDSALALKANAADVYTKAQVDNIILDIMPVGTAGPSATATFTTEIDADIVDVTTLLDASLTGYSSVTVTVNSVDTTIALGGTYYGGTLDVTTGVLTVTHAKVDLSSLSWSQTALTAEITDAYVTGNLQGLAKYPASNSIPLNAVCDNYAVTSMNSVYTTNVSIGMNVGGNMYVRNDGAGASPTGHLTYELATPITVQLEGVTLQAASGNNSVSSNTGNTTVKYKDSIQHYIDSKL